MLPNPSCNEELSYLRSPRQPLPPLLQSFLVAGVPETLFYIIGPALTGVVVVLLGVLRDFRGLGVLGFHVIEGIREPGMNHPP
ncbi:hypothetical protein ARMGADRAFT_1081129 [Armillaria gallica]|uniref:Uncharacterized protein n=1 Tax=Armillaria gallica TaxID=47427 RepID=A0A2H3DLI7_ARMGA|nr:hypothetical protein ARMGADRAFT_1081129 [Armillaria gallica]